jgi:flavin reductase (DIM6/NTAB) family NADH-FMN oxidoreductase RutF
VDPSVAPDGRPAVQESRPVDRWDYRRVMSRFATGVTVVTTRLDSLEHAITISSFASVSLDPTLVLFCVEKRARFHEAVLAAKAWAVSVLPASDEHVSRWFATHGRPDTDQVAGFRVSPGPVTGAPLFDDAIATLECRTWATYDGGDHTIVVGEVLAVDSPELAAPPLLYYQGQYRALTD